MQDLLLVFSHDTTMWLNVKASTAGARSGVVTPQTTKSAEPTSFHQISLDRIALPFLGQ